MKNILSITFFLLFLGVSQGQEANKYKYVVVDSQFPFVKKVDGYETSSLTKFLLNKVGFQAFLDNEETPENLSLNNNRCKALFANAISNSNMLTTKIVVELKDCNGKLVFTSEEGRSRIKDYKRAYRQAIRNAFKSFKKLNYSYDEGLMTVAKKSPVEKKPAVVKLKEEKKKPLIVTKKVTTKAKKTSRYQLLYAQVTENGYQLVNTKPQVVFILLKTQQENRFIIKDKNGTLVKSGDFWIAEYYEGNKLIVEKYEIKF